MHHCNESNEMVPEMKPDELILKNTQDQLGLLKPCTTSKRSIETLPENMLEETMLIKPCDKISAERLQKKRHVDLLEVDKMDWEEEGEEFSAIQIKVHEPLDVKALLSSQNRDYLLSPNGATVPISSLDGKYVLVCGFPVPIGIDSPESCNCMAIRALYSGLSRRGIADTVKLVIVVKLAPGFTKVDLDALFARLPVDCLTVPFTDTKYYHYLCETLGYRPSKPSLNLFPQLVVNPSGIVLQHSSSLLKKYGSLSFPFTFDHFEVIELEDEIIKHSIRSIDERFTPEELLCCKYLSKIGDNNISVATRSLEHSPVGFYLYLGGASMNKVQEIHQKCREKGLEFQIVLVPLPFYSDDPAAFYNLMKESALHHPTAASWLVSRFKEKRCRSLWRLFDCAKSEQLIILTPHGDFFGELYGLKVAYRYGIDAYPFTRDVVVEKMVAELRSFTLESLFDDCDVLDYISHKHVLLYLDHPLAYHNCHDLAQQLLTNKAKLEAKYPGFFVIFIALPSDDVRFSGSWGQFTAEDREYVSKRIFMKETPYSEDERPALIAFGEDGKILSRYAERRLPNRVPSASLFSDTLRFEIRAQITEDISDNW